MHKNRPTGQAKKDRMLAKHVMNRIMGRTDVVQTAPYVRRLSVTNQWQVIYTGEIKKGERFAAISDCDISKMNRKRLGAINLKSIKILYSEDVAEEYEKSTRVTYYKIDSDTDGASNDNGGTYEHIK